MECLFGKVSFETDFKRHLLQSKKKLIFAGAQPPGPTFADINRQSMFYLLRFSKFHSNLKKNYTFFADVCGQGMDLRPFRICPPPKSGIYFAIPILFIHI